MCDIVGIRSVGIAIATAADRLRQTKTRRRRMADKRKLITYRLSTEIVVSEAIRKAEFVFARLLDATK